MYLQFILLLLSTVCKAQYIVTTSVDNAGNTYWSPTAGAAKTSVQSLPTIPTLVYNCAIVPALCNNVAQLRPGAQNGGYNEVFGWDPDSDRKEKRREKRCPGSWKKGSAGRPRCPSPNQPQLHPLGISNALPPVVDQSDFAVLKEGANGDPERTGLMMTCDEFPPAMSIQGGKGPKGGPENGVTYCVPSKSISSQYAPYRKPTTIFDGNTEHSTKLRRCFPHAMIAASRCRTFRSHCLPVTIRCFDGFQLSTQCTRTSLRACTIWPFLSYFKILRQNSSLNQNTSLWVRNNRLVCRHSDLYPILKFRANPWRTTSDCSNQLKIIRVLEI